jgi:hypothetical protein
MPEVFYGEWAVAVVSHESAYNQRFIITGSDASDGTYLVGNPPPVSVFGAQWTLTIEYEGAGGWQASEIRRTPTYTAHDGLVINLGADVNFEGDYDEMVLTCRSLDPPLNPWRPVVNPYDFTLNEKTLEKFLREKEALDK